MTRPDLDAIRARCEAATAGPWHGAIPACDHDHDADDPAGAIEDPNSAIVANCVAEDGDVYFIMNARTDIPALLAYIDELESCTAHTTSWTIGETEWAHRIATLEHMLAEERENVDTLRAAVEHAEQRFVDEYDARKAAERQVEELKARDDETFDGTDAAHPAWWRGNDAGVRGAVNAMHRMLADAISDSGAFGSEELNDLHARIKSMLAEIAELKSRIVTLEAMKP